LTASSVIEVERFVRLAWGGSGAPSCRNASGWAMATEERDPVDERDTFGEVLEVPPRPEGS